MRGRKCFHICSGLHGATSPDMYVYLNFLEPMNGYLLEEELLHM